jgi:hypothetical protein
VVSTTSSFTFPFFERQANGVGVGVSVGGACVGVLEGSGVRVGGTTVWVAVGALAEEQAVSKARNDNLINEMTA